MIVLDFCELCIDNTQLKVNLYDNGKDKVVWTGRADDIPEEFAFREVECYDLPEKAYELTLNMGSEE